MKIHQLILVPKIQQFWMPLPLWNLQRSFAKHFFYIKTTYKPGVPGTRKKQQPTTKKKTTTCRATTIPSHNHCWSQKAKSGHSGKKLVRCLLYLLEIRYNFMCIDVIFRVLYENNPSACFILSVKIYIWSYGSSFFYLYQKYS